MALRVWLPLNGNLENKGISDITITNNGATVDNSGKIGKCYSFSNNSLYGDLAGINNITQASGCCWIYLTNLNSAQYFFHFGGQASYPAKFSMDYEGSLRSQINGTEYNSGITLTINTWYHVAFTWNGTNIKWYVNGEEKATKGTSGTFSASNHFAIGARTNSTAGNAFSYYITSGGKLNDVRIYDHCLSAKEVKEISQGLVLHYKLNGFSGGAGENIILTNSDFSGGTTDWSNWATVQSREIVTIKDKKWAHIVKTANAYGGYSRVITIEPNTVYTVSATFYASGTTKGILWWHYRSSEGGANLSQSSKSFDLTTIPQRYSAQIPIYTNANYTVDRLNLMIGTPTETFGDVDIYFTDIKIEEGSIATSYIQSNSELGIDTTKAIDSSGYGNYAYTDDIIFVSEKGPRYNVVADFSKGGNSSSWELPTSKGNTIAFWCSVSDWSEYNLFGAICQGSNWGITSHDNNLILELISYRSAENSNYNLSQTYSWTLMPTSSLGADWHYFVLTYLNHEIKFYLDGILYQTINNISTDIADYFYTNYLTLAPSPIA